jgi:general secretion pathway protein G
MKHLHERRTVDGQKGFTLIEIMIVLALIAVAGTFVVNQLISRLDEGNYSAAKTQIGNFKTLLEDYRRYCNIYPTSQQGLDALVAKPTAAPDCKNYPASGFIRGGKVPADPWGNPYLYESPDDGKSYVITSLGKDGKESGEGFDKDIKSNEL